MFIVLGSAKAIKLAVFGEFYKMIKAGLKADLGLIEWLRQ